MNADTDELSSSLRRAFERTSELQWLLTSVGVVTAANPAVFRAFGFDPRGQSIAEMCDALSSESVRQALESVAGGAVVHQDLSFPNGLSLEVVFVPAGEGIVASGRERQLSRSEAERLAELNRRYETKVRELATLTGRLRELAVTDTLTNLFTRRAFLERAEAEWGRAQRQRTVLSCILIDLDNFKSVNDSHGHAAGDAVLKLFGSLFRTAVRTSDVPARYGGEEFIALLPQTNEAGALMLAERIRSRLGECPAELPSGNFIKVTCSIGVASSEHGAKSLTELLARADAALYRSKSEGRDRVSVGREESQ